jgi:hypothetical protein
MERAPGPDCVEMARSAIFRQPFPEECIMSLRTFVLAVVLAAPAGPLAGQQKAPAGHDAVMADSLTGWIAQLRAAAPETRHDAAYNIASMGPAAAPAVPDLITALERPGEVAVVLYPIEVALREIGPPAKAALPALEKFLDDPNDDVAFMARKAIKAIGGDAAADSTSH